MDREKTDQLIADLGKALETGSAGSEYAAERVWQLLEDLARQVAREEIASLSGLVMRQLQLRHAGDPVKAFAAAFSEAMRDFGGSDSEPGPRSTV